MRPASLSLLVVVVACEPSTPRATGPTPAPPLSIAPVASAAPAVAAPLVVPPRPAPPVKKLVAAPGHTCALLVSGEVACWGGGIGPLVNGYRTSVKRPEKVPGLRDLVDVATGVYHTCVLRNDGKVLCWGADADDEPVVVPKLDDIVEIASRGFHSCARRRDGHVFCWGQNDRGQLGRAPVTGQFGPEPVKGVVEVPGLADAVEIVTSHSRSCARRATGRVVCWGEPLYGVPGPRGGLQSFPDVTDAAGLAADSATCVVRANGEAVCHGGMLAGERRKLMPKDVTSLAVSVGVECAALRGGEVHCWGSGVSGELGDGTTGSRQEPKPVAGLTDATQVVASWNHLCALRKNGEVVCWGANNEAQLGIGLDDVERKPFVVPTVSATKVAAGSGQSCAIGPDRKVACWGYDITKDQYSARDTPAPVDGLGEVTEVALGSGHGCALTTSGGAVCWGDAGSLGAQMPYRNDRSVHPVAGVSDAVAIAAGDKHTCVRKKDGTVACWGQNRAGQLGDGTNTSSVAAVAVKGVTDAVDVACGEQHTCAVRKTGDVVCWGSNHSGQLGVFGPSGDPVPASPMPLAVPPVHGATAIAAGFAHTCALTGGRLTCWGHEHHGPIMCVDPGGCRGQRFVEVQGIADAVSVTGAGRRTCAVRASAVTCWSKADEQTSDARDVALTLPVQLAVSGGHACAVTQGKVACWGKNDAGEVGAPPPYRTTPGPIAW